MQVCKAERSRQQGRKEEAMNTELSHQMILISCSVQGTRTQHKTHTHIYCYTTLRERVNPTTKEGSSNVGEVNWKVEQVSF